MLFFMSYWLLSKWKRHWKAWLEGKRLILSRGSWSDYG